MTRFLEDPLPVILLGLGIEAVLVLFFLQSRKSVLFVAALVVALFTVLGVFVEQMIQTEREKVETLLSDIAAAAEANDLQAVLSFLSPKAKNIRSIINRRMPNGTIERARFIGKLNIVVDEDTSPATATAEFKIFVKGKWGRSDMNGAVYSDVEVQLERDGERWLIIEMRDVERKW